MRWYSVNRRYGIWYFVHIYDCAHPSYKFEVENLASIFDASQSLQKIAGKKCKICAEFARKLRVICAICASCAQIKLKNRRNFAKYLRVNVLWLRRKVFFTILFKKYSTITVIFLVASCERSFSKLKLILTYLRAPTPYDKITLGICAARH